MKLSVVIPAFDESNKIASDIKSACEFFQNNGFEGEIIISDDGSKDGTSEQALKTGGDCPAKIEIKVIRNEIHRGKGYAIRNAMKQSTGDYVMFADSGCCVPYDNALRGLKLLTAGECDIAHGSRRMACSDIIKDQGLYRHICSVLFHRFIQFLMKIPAELTDTQCGFKIYKGDVGRKLYSECITDGFMFDIEIIIRALNQGYGIKEFPIEWSCDPDSRLSPTRSFWRILAELREIKAILKSGKQKTKNHSQ